jgi:nucleotide-binding universal stress UspA family protein
MSSTKANGHGGGVIVCGVDGSTVSREALRTADRLSEQLGLSLVVAHVVPVRPLRARPNAASGASATTDEIAAGEELLREQCDAAGLAQARRRLLVGRPAERLAELADELEAGLIVVGSRGQRLRQAAVVGSVSSELLGLAPCPVLVLPARAVDWERKEPLTAA